MDLKNLFSKVVDLARSAIGGSPGPEEREPPARERQAVADEVERRAAAGDPDAAAEGEDVRVDVEKGTTLAIRWVVGAHGIERARMVLGEDGTLALRVIVVTRDETTVTSTPVEQSPVPRVGQTWLDEVAPGALCVASIGLRAGERFVSIAHAPVARTAH